MHLWYFYEEMKQTKRKRPSDEDEMKATESIFAMFMWSSLEFWEGFFFFGYVAQGILFYSSYLIGVHLNLLSTFDLNRGRGRNWNAIGKLSSKVSSATNYCVSCCLLVFCIFIKLCIFTVRCESCHGQAERLLDSAREMEDSIAVNLRFVHFD